MTGLLLVLLLVPEVGFFTDAADLALAGDEGRIRIVVRNRSPFALDDLRLQVHAARPLSLEVRPAGIPHCRPGERCTFQVTARRRADTPPARFPLDFEVSSRRFPHLLASRLFADASPGAGRRREWMDAGTINIKRTGRRVHLLAMLLAAGMPVLVLLGLGLYFRRQSRRRAADNLPDNKEKSRGQAR
ncbi:MAG: hypothetical protein DRI34_02895 [Deltaproteobacteria bacterium]|nr:MAG: hypothetical protein DRI34_02895 [Deltaproteobacteria bacterium]